MKFGREEHARITAAIREAERSTSGEIFCVFAHRVSQHADVVIAWAAGLALVLPVLMIPFGFNPAWLPGFSAGWTAAHLAATEITVALTLAAYAAFQLLVFAFVCLIGCIPDVRRWMTPRTLRASRCRRAAMNQFLAHGLHVTENRTGVLIFASAFDHHVEIIADKAIHDVVDSGVWMDAVAALARHLGDDRAAEGYEAAIALCGQVLSGHFPATSSDRNELPDRLVEI
ncbi:MAG: TPM domain-containing protein [Brevundimonas sp.]|uniref:TPM domain-containing protein n=1 Tax=Brevundimonas sp. TaxID=1871086 RepID=UPI003918C580